MAKSIYFKLARSNVRRSREVYGPYFLATVVMSGVYFLILTLLFSKGLRNVPGGETAMAMFMMGTIVFTLFAYGFMLYINAFLTKRRKKEFGLYSVLGMNRSHVARVLRYELLMVVGGGVAVGILAGMAFGRLLFMLMLRVMRAAVAGSQFTLSPMAFAGTLALFAAVLLSCDAYNGLRVRLSATTELLQSDRRGEKDSKLVIPAAILGIVLLLVTYGFALWVNVPALSLAFFFPAAFVVIIATYLLFFAGSIALLRVLRRNEKLYYKSDNFVAISGMFHRMRVNARGLATICIFSTMLLVTVAGATSLYFGQEAIVRTQNPYDMRLMLPYENEEPLKGAARQQAVEALSAEVDTLARQHGVQVHAQIDERMQPGDGLRQLGIVTYTPDAPPLQVGSVISAGNSVYFDVSGSTEGIDALAGALSNTPGVTYVHSIEDSRRSGYGMFGGLLFLAAFFAVLFLVMMVLMIYFKQITEGNEDKERFAIMQKVGMRDDEVKSTINKQILWVFFLPLVMAICHVLASSRMMTQMISLFGMLDYRVTISCIGVTALVFAAVYLLVYRQTAKVYYRIVKW